MGKLAIAVIVVLAIIAVFSVIRAMSKTARCKSNASCGAGRVCGSDGKCVLPRAASIGDRGYGDHLHGWFDAQGQGVPNDYCRYVGGSATEKPWFSCKLAGSDKEYSAKGAVDPVKIRASCDSGSGGGCGLPLW